MLGYLAEVTMERSSTQLPSLLRSRLQYIRWIQIWN